MEDWGGGGGGTETYRGETLASSLVSPAKLIRPTIKFEEGRRDEVKEVDPREESLAYEKKSQHKVITRSV